ncbi:unnamed protein product [Orchesella dallaii]|uniref:Polycystin-2 n=1 Tax=Orchesella dallaii TaxID=48710 RepID=A0ABP1S5V3_9HEXA
MVKGLYWKYWYGVVNPAYAIPPQHQGVLHENRLLGRPRLRQLRVTNEPCPISDKFLRLFRECYPPYDAKYEETGEFNPTLGSLDAWRYHSEATLGGTTHWGRLATYSGGGAIQVLGSDEDETIQIMTELKNNLWISRATRVLFLDFTLYNANVNLFCIVKLVWEFPATGGLVTSWSIRTIRLIRYATPYEIFILILEFIFVAFTVYYTLQEIFEILSAKCKDYWTDFWTYLDICILLMSYTCIGFSIYRHILVERNLEELIKDPNSYANFYWLGFWESQYNNVVAVLVFLTWIKLFKYISINSTMAQLSNTMSRCATDVGGFAIMFFIVFFAFAQLGYLLFGSKVEDFRTFYDTVFTLLRCILGDFNFRAIESANRVLGPIFFLTYVFFVFFVLLNMFLAIINDTYSEVKAEANAHAQEYEVTDYLRQGMNSWFGNFGCRNRKLDAMNKAKLANTEHVIANDELRQNLRNCNYSDVEVEMFLTRYELDEDRPIDEAEAEHVLGSLEGYHPDSRPNDVNFNDKKHYENNSKHVTDQEISELQSRVGVLESSLTAVNRKMDLLLNKLDPVVKPKVQIDPAMTLQF